MNQLKYKDFSACANKPNSKKYRIYLNQKLGEGQYGKVYKGSF